jgi:hypothetical protein
VIGSIEIGWVTDGTTELDQFEWVGIIKGMEFGDYVGALGH